jgi:TRAP-type mannitol/chloroaromatic compound transport system permease small subunit
MVLLLKLSHGIDTFNRWIGQFFALMVLVSAGGRASA